MILLLAFLLNVHAASELPVAETTDQWCGLLAKDLRSVNLKSCQTRSWQVEAKSNGQIILPKTTSGPEDGRKVLVIGGIHGDEISSISLVFRWMDFLDRLPADSALKKMHFVFLPLLNPDGFLSSPRTRTNLSGVDLNRNFPTKDWDKSALSYWVKQTKKDKRRFPGHKSSSEVETNYCLKLINDIQPEIVISVHAPYGILDHDGPVAFPKNLKSPLPVKALGSFPGSLGRYVGVERKIPVITVELMTAGTMPDPKAVEELFMYVLNSKPNEVQSVLR